MTTDSAPLSSSPPRRKGRGLFWAGIGVCFLGLALVFAQFALQILFVPWYLPVLVTLGAGFLLWSLLQGRSMGRFITFGLLTAFAAFQWFFLVSLAQLPTYQGPAQAGNRIPEFQTALADGKPFTQLTLQDGTPTVMVFFRGRW